LIELATRNLTRTASETIIFIIIIIIVVINCIASLFIAAFQLLKGDKPAMFVSESQALLDGLTSRSVLQSPSTDRHHHLFAWSSPLIELESMRF
jgi:flagellar basal body-associated protein FliL